MKTPKGLTLATRLECMSCRKEDERTRSGKLWCKSCDDEMACEEWVTTMIEEADHA